MWFELDRFRLRLSPARQAVRPSFCFCHSPLVVTKPLTISLFVSLSSTTTTTKKTLIVATSLQVCYLPRPLMCRSMRGDARGKKRSLGLVKARRSIASLPHTRGQRWLERTLKGCQYVSHSIVSKAYNLLINTYAKEEQMD